MAVKAWLAWLVLTVSFSEKTCTSVFSPEPPPAASCLSLEIDPALLVPDFGPLVESYYLSTDSGSVFQNSCLRHMRSSPETRNPPRIGITWQGQLCPVPSLQHANCNFLTEYQIFWQSSSGIIFLVTGLSKFWLAIQVLDYSRTCSTSCL